MRMTGSDNYLNVRVGNAAAGRVAHPSHAGWPAGCRDTAPVTARSLTHDSLRDSARSLPAEALLENRMSFLDGLPALVQSKARWNICA